MEYREQLLALVKAYCSRPGAPSEARIATVIRNQGAFFLKIAHGASCTVDTYLQVKEWFADHWPSDLAWPEGVDRPGVLPTGIDRSSSDAAA